MGKSWLSNENNSDAEDCATWQVLIDWNISSINTTSTFQSNKMLPCHRSTPRQYFGPIASWHTIDQCHIISQCHIVGPIGCHHRSMPHLRPVNVNSVVLVNSTAYVNVSYKWIIPYMWTIPNNLYALMVFDCSEFKNTIRFVVRLLISCEMAKISLKHIKYLNYNKMHIIKC